MMESNKLESVIEELSSLANLQVPQPSKEDEKKFRKILVEMGRSTSSVDMDSTLETMETMSSVSWKSKKSQPTTHRQNMDEKNVARRPPPPPRVQSCGLGRGRPVQSGDSKSLIMNDIQELMKKM